MSASSSNMEAATASMICRHLVARASVKRTATMKEVTRRVLFDVYVEAIHKQSYRKGALPLRENATTTECMFPHVPFGVKLDIMAFLGIHDLARLALTCRTFNKFASGAAFHRLEHSLGINGMEMRLLSGPRFSFKGSLGVLHHSLVLNSFQHKDSPVHTRLACGEQYTILARGDNVYSAGILPERRASAPNYRVTPLRLSVPIKVADVACGSDFYAWVEGREHWRVDGWRPPEERGGHVISVAAGLDHGAVLTNRGDVFGFGLVNPNFGCGQRPSNMERLEIPNPAVSVYCGGNILLMVDARRRLYQLAIGPTKPIFEQISQPYQPSSSSTGYPKPYPESTPPSCSYARIRGVSGVTHVACGRKHTIILGEWNGHSEIWGIGRNHEGQLAVGSDWSGNSGSTPTPTHAIAAALVHDAAGNALTQQVENQPPNFPQVFAPPPQHNSDEEAELESLRKHHRTPLVCRLLNAAVRRRIVRVVHFLSLSFLMTTFSLQTEESAQTFLQCF